MTLVISSLSSQSQGGIEIVPAPSDIRLTSEGFHSLDSTVRSIRRVDSGILSPDYKSGPEGHSFGIVVTASSGTITAEGPAGWRVSITPTAVTMQVRTSPNSGFATSSNLPRNINGIPANSTFTLEVHQRTDSDSHKCVTDFYLNGSLVSSYNSSHEALVAAFSKPVYSVDIQSSTMYLRDVYFKDGYPFKGWASERLSLEVKSGSGLEAPNLVDVQNTSAVVPLTGNTNLNLVASNRSLSGEFNTATATAIFNNTNKVRRRALSTLTGDDAKISEDSKPATSYVVNPTAEQLKEKAFNLNSSVTPGTLEDHKEFTVTKTESSNVTYLTGVPIQGELRSPGLFSDGKFVYLTGGYGLNPTLEVVSGLYQFYEPENTWMCQSFPRLTSTAYNRKEPSIAVYDGSAYLAPGEYQANKGSVPVNHNAVLRHNLNGRSVSPNVTSSHTASNPAVAGLDFDQLSAVAVGDLIYMFGNNSEGAGIVFNTVTGTGTKLPVAHTKITRRNCAVNLNGTIYLLGCEDARQRPRAVYSVNVETGASALVSLSSFDITEDFGMYVDENSIYVLGGPNNLAFRFGQEFHNWEPLGKFTDAEFQVFKCNPGFCQVGRAFYVAGGLDANNFARIDLPEGSFTDNGETVTQEPEKDSTDLLYRLDNTLKSSIVGVPGLIPHRGIHTYSDNSKFADSKSLEFNGKYGVAADDLNFVGVMGITAGAWILPDAGTEDADLISLKWDLTGQGMGLRISSEGRLTYRSTITNSTFSTDRGAIVYGEWVHVAFTLALSGVATLYINGLKVKSQRVSPQRETFILLNLGFNDEGATGYFKGNMSDAFAFGRELFPYEVAWIGSGWDRLESHLTAPEDDKYPEVGDFIPLYHYSMDGSPSGKGTNVVPLTPQGVEQYALDSPHEGFRKSLLFTGNNGMKGPLKKAPITGPTEFTLSLWIKSDILTTGNQFLLEQILYYDGTSANNGGSFRLYIGRTGQLYFQLYTDDNIARTDNTQASLRPNTWHHIAAVREASGRTRLYFDGKQGITLDLPMTDLLSYHQFKIGYAQASNNAGLGSFFLGQMCDIVGLDRALTKGEVAWMAMPNNRVDATLIQKSEPQDTFLGETSVDQLIDGTTLASLVGLEGKTPINNTLPWLTFEDRNGSLLYVPRAPLCRDVGSLQLDALGIMFGETTVNIKGLEYKVRLLTGADSLDHPFATRSNSPNVSDSEWDRLIGNVHDGVNTLPDLTAPGYWPVYSNGQLQTNIPTVCQGYTATGNRSALRGSSNRFSYVNYTVQEGNTSVGWRPVLELVNRTPKPATTFKGYVTSNDLISGDSLAFAMELEAGVGINSDVGWLHFINEEGLSVYIAKKPLRHSLSWDELKDAYLVEGNKVLPLNGKKYRVRLVKGVDTLPEELDAGFYDNVTLPSEWLSLMPSVHDGVHQDESNVTPSGHWPLYSDDDLGVTTTDTNLGAVTICQETIGLECLTFGSSGISNLKKELTSYSGSDMGWRPVLEELLEPKDLYLGEVQESDLAHPSELVGDLEILPDNWTEGNNSWLEFVTSEGTTLFVSKKNVAVNVSWDDLNSAGLVSGSKTVDLNGRTYKVRLLTGANENPFEGTVGVNPLNTEESEWDRLIQSVYTPEGSDLEDKTRAGYWPIFSAEELSGGLNPSASWTQESSNSLEEGVVEYVARGSKFKISELFAERGDIGNPAIGWRPVLELIPPVRPDFDFMGEVVPSLMLDGAALSTAVSLSEGTALNNLAGWLKFNTVEDKVLYVSKLPTRSSVSWDTLNSLGLLEGSKVIALKGVLYRVRTLSGSIDDPYNPLDVSPLPAEWFRLLGSIHNGIHSNPTNTAYEGYWPIYGDTELGIDGASRGRHNWCVEGYYEEQPDEGPILPEKALLRGGAGIESIEGFVTSRRADDTGWRPVLEVLPTHSLEVSRPDDLPLFLFRFEGSLMGEGESPPTLTQVGSGLSFDMDGPHTLHRTCIKFDKTFYLKGAKSPLIGTGAITLGMWLKPTDLTASTSHILGQQDEQSRQSGSNLHISPYINGAGNNKIFNRMKVNDTTTTLSGPASNQNSLAVDVWTHCTFVRSATGELKLYLNGALISKSQNQIQTLLSDSVLFIGTNLSTTPSADRFTGNMKDVFAYNRELSAEEIAWIVQPLNRFEIVPLEPTGIKPVVLLRLNRSLRNEGSATGTDVSSYGDLTYTETDPHDRGDLSYYSSEGNYLATPSREIVSGSGTITIGMWISPDMLKEGTLLSYHPYASLIGGFNLKLTETGSIKFEQGSGEVESKSGIISIGDWHHVSVVRYSSGRVVIMVNGTVVFSGIMEVSSLSANRLVVGAQLSSISEPLLAFSGNIKDVVLYNREVKQRELSWLSVKGNVVEPSSEYLPPEATEPEYLFKGEVQPPELISGNELALIVGLDAGTYHNEEEPWLEFAKGDELSIFVAKKSLRYGMSKDDLVACDLVTGDKIVDILGRSFKVRLLKGTDNDPWEYERSMEIDPDNVSSSEWDRFILNVHDGIHTHGAVTATKGYWPLYSNQELNVDGGFGSFSFTQESSTNVGQLHVTRGGNGVTSLRTVSSVLNDEYGWRPVLEEIVPIVVDPVDPVDPDPVDPVDPDPVDPVDPEEEELVVPEEEEPEEEEPVDPVP